MAAQKFTILFIVIFLLSIVSGSVIQSRQRRFRRVHLPFLGIGPSCHGCPPHFCDDDPAIVHGYCCGCARFFDVLPVICRPDLICPLNPLALCSDFEYMMHCCCG